MYVQIPLRKRHADPIHTESRFQGRPVCNLTFAVRPAPDCYFSDKPRSTSVELIPDHKAEKCRIDLSVFTHQSIFVGVVKSPHPGTKSEAIVIGETA